MTVVQRRIRKIINWTTEEEKIIANVILAEVSIGSTLQKAYNIATEKVNAAFGNDRTSEGVAFRWNSILKNNYIKEFETVKAQGKLARGNAPITPKQQSFEDIKESDEVETFIKQTPVNNISKLPNEEEVPKVSKPEGLAATALEELENVKLFIENSVNQNLEIEVLRTQLAFEQEESRKKDIKYSNLEKKYEVLEEDYNAILKLIDRARKLTVSEENHQIEKSEPNKFQMERNGNLVKR